ncbi:MAG: RHS repeat-associated core domain-containing protein [Phycisphaerales bacterium]|nr:RHS repeat-associated core domain-containing protein [Phycisphaerales bacterium]
MSNELNQYTRAQQTGGPAPFSTDFDHDADGNLIRMVSFGDANCDSVLNNFDIDAFVAAALDAEEEEAPHDYCVAAGLSESGSPSPCQACWAARETWGDLNGDGVFNNFDLDPFVSVLVGGASSPSYRTYVWDAENRLIEVHPAHPVGSTYSPANNDERWRYVYDYLGRRVEKHHDKYVSGSWVTQNRTRFVYDGWNLIQELNVPTSGDPTVLRQYTWGLDLSGLNGDSSVSGLHGAGGIGGLLAVLDTNNTTTTSDDRSFAYLYDANGNVGQLVEWASDAGGSTGMAWSAGRVVAKYEYDPYGNIVGPDADNDGNIAEEAGPYAAINPFRFSTKFLDAETGLSYYGYRYYSPRLGRWINRDPIGEKGGFALYAFVANHPVNAWDALGLFECERVIDNAPAGAAGGAFQWISEWQLLAVSIVSTVIGTGEHVSVSRADKVKATWQRYYSELFKCCSGPGGAPEYLWGAPSLALGHTMIDIPDTMAPLALHATGSTPAPLTGVDIGSYGSFDDTTKSELLQLARAHGPPDAPTVWAYGGLRGPAGMTNLVKHVCCDSQGAVGWPGTPASNSPPPRPAAPTPLPL